MTEQDNSLISQLLTLLNSDKQFSDIRLESDAPVMIKTSQGWVDAHFFDYISVDEIRDFLQKLEPNWEHLLDKHGSINRPLNLQNWRLRINAYLAFGGTKQMASIRKVPVNAPSIQEVGLPTTTRALLESTSGIILISGPTGAGKTTSMAAMVDVINATRNAHVLSIEDPIEFLHKGKKSIFSQREIGVDCMSFSDGVKDALRQRPDVIVIGEIRDKETAEQAILAGESGHLVIGTLHASSAAGTVTKLLGFFNADERESRLQSLSSSLIGVFNQTLIPKKSGDGYALAVDFIANHKRQYSKVLGDPSQITLTMERKDKDDLSIMLADSVTKLIQDNIVDKAEAARCVSGNAAVYDKLRNL